MSALFSSTPTAAGSRESTRAFIAQRAFDKWVQKGRPLGTDLQDWLEAEAELEQMRELAQQLAQTNVFLEEVLEQSRQREQTLRQAEERYHGIFDNAVEGIFQTTREGRFFTANRALVRMLGFKSAEDLIANVQHIGQQLHVTPERRCDFQRLLEERGQVQGFECQVYRKDGHILWVSLAARAVRDATGAIEYFEGTAEDISERKRAEEALRHSEALYHTLVDNLPVCVLLKDVHGRFLFCNQACCAALKRALPDIVGKTDLDFYSPELAQKYIYDDRRVIATREVLEAIEEHQDPEGESSYVQVLKAPLFDAHGEVIGVQCLYWDITARKQAEAELARTAVEFQVARSIQQKLFPSDTPTVAGMDIGVATFGFDIGGGSYPAEAIGGDYYDFIPLRDGSLAIAIGDVSGHGVGPALLMAETRALLRAFAQTETDVSTILRLVNRVLVPDIDSDRFITLLLAKLDPRRRTLVYASAGHPTGYLLDEHGIVKRALPSTGYPLGILEETCFPAVTIENPLQAGDIVVLMTDGIVEARSPYGMAFGQQRPLDLVRVYRKATAKEIVHNLYFGVRAFAQSLPQFDDITATVIKVGPLP